MTQDFDARDSLIPPPPIPAIALDFSRSIHKLMDGKSKDEATVNNALTGMDGMFDLIAAGLYNLASMLVGEGEESIRLVEEAVATAEAPICDDPATARRVTRRTLSVHALKLLAQRTPELLAAPVGVTPVHTCIEDDDLDSVGVSHEEFETMMGGSDRERVRNWLGSLPEPLRVVFVLRAVAGFTADETAALLVAHGGPRAAGWTVDAVREFFRQALCSLASQLIQSVR